MKKGIILGLILTLILGIGLSLAKDNGEKGLKVFISVDMEGIAGVVNWEEVNRSGLDYNLFRRLMTEETNAAIEGALEAGAGYILVRDAHGSGRNLLPDLLNPKAELIRDWSGGPFSMMEGIDSTFDAVIFIGYHAKAGTPNGVLKHTMNSRTIADVKLNGISVPEAGINGAIAGYFGVPVVFIAGDKAICKQAKDLFPWVEAVAVKEGIGSAVKTLHPKVARKRIKERVYYALTHLKKYKPFVIKPPYTIEVTFIDEVLANKVSFIPYAKRTGPLSVSFTDDDFIQVLRFFKTALAVR